MTRCTFLITCLMLSGTVCGQPDWQLDGRPGSLKPGDDITYKVELQGSLSEGQTPLWLNANKYGLSSLEARNGYLRGAVVRPLANDSLRRWGMGYGVDVAVPLGYTSKVVAQQVFVEARWLHGVLGVGAKEYPMAMKNQSLSSGAQTLGINARPVPQVRLSLPDYWTIPAFGRWLALKGHLAYGWLTDGAWQKDFRAAQSKYTEDVRYHSKAGFLRIGSEDRFVPWSLELGVEMATLFGGRSHRPDGQGGMATIVNASGLKSYLRALIPGGADAPEGGSAYQNEEGDILGSWMMRLNYDAESWKVGVYMDKYFEDHSSMLMLDYDGYGDGDEWNVKKRTHFFRYDFKDCMLGAELNIKYGRWIRNVVVEYLYSKYQSGPIYHDHTPGWSDHVSGRDDYYNHYIFAGWQHWGQAIGNPLYRSPIYNDNGQIRFENTRMVAWHLGIDGGLTEKLDYRVLATYQTGLGTYTLPYDRKRHNTSLLIEAAYRLPQGWRMKGAVGMDFGRILGNQTGLQLTVTKSGIFSL